MNSTATKIILPERVTAWANELARVNLWGAKPEAKSSYNVRNVKGQFAKLRNNPGVVKCRPLPTDGDAADSLLDFSVR